MAEPNINATPEAGDDERRARVRYSTNQTTLCQRSSAHADDFWLLGKIQDLSTTGIRLLLNRPFDPGSLISIEPTKPTKEVSRVPDARVVFARKDAKAGWVIGCEFVQTLSPQELQALL